MPVLVEDLTNDAKKVGLTRELIEARVNGVLRKNGLRPIDAETSDLPYHDALDSNARLGLHDAITHSLDEAGMAGASLKDALRSLFDGLKAEGVGFGVLL
jgi:hypothetical protein